MASSTNRIEKSISLKAQQSRVWKALSDSTEFGAWFGMKFSAPFAVGEKVTGQITYPGYEHVKGDMWIEHIDPEHTLSFRWHPHAVDPKVDYSKEPTTLVEFKLQPIPEGTLVTVAESGFDKLPPERRDLAFRMNAGGWEAQMQNIQKHVGG